MSAFREALLADPALVLDDAELMNALLNAELKAKGQNIIDLRAAFTARLEDRLEQLSGAHRAVLAAAYENVAGTQQLHRAVLALLDTADFDAFLRVLVVDLAGILGVDQVRLCFESTTAQPGSGVGPKGLEDSIIALPRDGAGVYLSISGPARKVVLRRVSDGLYAPELPEPASEAVLSLDLGPGRLPGLLLLGAQDPERFGPDQGTDLLQFFTQSVELMLRRWLA
ncbi:DUF484 family protein [Paracoccaceae bacterium GXU_MW_L88]